MIEVKCASICERADDHTAVALLAGATVAGFCFGLLLERITRDRPQ